MALPLSAGDVHPSELLDPMMTLMSLEELAQPSILFLHAFLSLLPTHIHSHCVPFTATRSLADVAKQADLHFLAHPSVQPQVFEAASHRMRTGSMPTSLPWTS